MGEDGDGEGLQLGSEERRAGKECGSWWSPYHQKKNKLISSRSQEIGTANCRARVWISVVGVPLNENANIW